MSRTTDARGKHALWAIVAACAMVTVLGTAGAWSSRISAAITTPDRVDARVNRLTAFSTAPEPGLLGGVLPIAHNAVAMLTGFAAPPGSSGPDVRRATFLVYGTPMELPYTVTKDGKAFLSDDMYLGFASEIESQPLAAVVTLGQAWPNGVVYWGIEEGEFSDAYEAIIEAAVNLWEDATPVNFIKQDGFPKLIFTVEDDSDATCHSKVGWQGGAFQYVYLKPSVCSGAAGIGHEIGHALGLFHEQQRPDRDSFITVNENNILDGKDGDFELKDDAYTLGDFGWDSLMLYRSMRFSKNGGPTIVRKGAMTYRGDSTPSYPDGRNWRPFRLGESLNVFQVGYGDFDGDGNDEIYQRTTHEFLIANTDATNTSWQHLNTTLFAKDWEAVGDFNGDGADDLLGGVGNEWWLSLNGSGAWRKVFTSGPPRSQLGFADMNGDGRTDVFVADGRSWRYVESYGFSAGWTMKFLQARNETMPILRLGKFKSPRGVANNAAKADVFRTDGTTWFVSYDALTGWIPVNASSQPLSHLRFGDVGGDNFTDVVTAWVDSNGELSRFSDGALGSWTALYANCPDAPYFVIANLDGGKDDIVADGIFDGQRQVVDAGSAFGVTRIYFGTWQYSASGTGPWTMLNVSDIPMSEIRFGRFDDDDVGDAFHANGTYWRVSFDSVSPWMNINASEFAGSDLLLGKFGGGSTNNWARTDVMRATGSEWHVSYDGMGSWQYLNGSSYTLSDLKLGDFNGNGLHDIFRADGSTWWVSQDGVGPWTAINSSGYTTSQLGIGHFPFLGGATNAAGKADVFVANGSQWLISADGVGPWEQLNTSGYYLSDLAFCDFDGNGFTDIFRADGGSWYVSRDGTQPWEWLNGSSKTIPDLKFADANGDGKCDVIASFDCLGCTIQNQ